MLPAPLRGKERRERRNRGRALERKKKRKSGRA
jgi:hypothetical protein